MEKYALYYWRLNQGFGNIGDELSKVLIQKINPNIKSVYDVAFEYKILGIGSILNRAKNEDIVWGSGFLNENENFYAEKLNIKLLRGPLSYNIIKNKCKFDENYGDPALITSYYFPINEDKIYDVGIIPHFSQKIETFNKIKKINIKNVLLLSPTLKYDIFLKLLNQCKVILSSSLHGLILADSYNIPNAHLNFKPKSVDCFKFMDYFASQDRKIEFNDDIFEALDKVKISNKPNLKNILNTFPKFF